MKRAYARLQERFARVAIIQEARSVLSWDAAAMMPLGGAAARGDQLAVLAGLSHSLLTSQEMTDDLAAAYEEPLESDWDTANLGLMRCSHVRAAALPLDLVESSERTNSACEKVWREARVSSDFRMVAPYLAEVVNLVRHKAAALGPALGLEPYDALMDGYQRGIGAAEVTSLFDRYETFFPNALEAAERLQGLRPIPAALEGSFTTDRQIEVCRRLAGRAGIDFDHARLDSSTHPFCGGTPTDVRITTRYDEADPAMAIFGVLHETGHALYERGLPASYRRQLVGQAAGMAAHESQSLIIEMQACRSDQFLGWLGRELHGSFGGRVECYTPLNLQLLWRRVERGFIRVDADEITYPAHIILRFRLERALISGALDVVDLPTAWQDESKSLLGVAPPDDAHGCLQDIHWYDGAFGYFPSYTLGAMAAAQLFASARRVCPDLEEAFGRGDLEPLLRWLRLHVHRHGSRLGFNDLLQAATGSRLDPTFFEAHLSQRYMMTS